MALKRLALGGAYLALACGFTLLVVWECSLGFVASTNGGASFGTFPGVACFVLSLQLGLIAWFFILSAGTFRGKPAENSAAKTTVTRGFGLVLALLGVWAAGELAVAAVGLVLRGSDDLVSKVITGTCLLAGVGVFCTLLWSMILQPLLSRPKDPADRP